MPGPAPKPTKLKLLEGNPGHQRINRKEPQPAEGIQSRPEWLLPEAKREWVRVCGHLEAIGLLAVVDRGVLAAYCQAWARWVEAEQYITQHGATMQVESKANGVYDQPRPQVAMAQKYYQLMLSAGAKLGLSPADRTRLSTPEPKRDPLEDLLNGTD